MIPGQKSTHCNTVFASITFGEQTRSVTSEGLRLIETVHRGDMRLPEHEHEDPSIVAVIAGGWDETVESRSFVCRPGSFLVKPAGAKHANSYGTEHSRSITIQLAVTCAAQWECSRKAFGGSVQFQSPKTAMRLTALLRRPADYASRMQLEEEVASILSLITVSDSGRRAPGLVRCLKAARDDLLDGRLHGMQLVDVAMECGLTPSAFTHAFRREFGSTPSSLVRRRRIENACALLRTGEPLSKIAAIAGFADQAHFNREFKRAFRTTPALYRLSLTA
jgi:AraC family transcriptional regulator